MVGCRYVDCGTIGGTKNKFQQQMWISWDEIGLLICLDGRLLLLLPLESICHRFRHTCKVHKALTVHSQVWGTGNFILHNKSIVKCKLYYNLSKICLNILACFVRNVFFFWFLLFFSCSMCLSHRLTVHLE